MNRQKIACNCKNITYGMIEDVIKAGAKNYEDVEKQLRFRCRRDVVVATGSALCHGLIALLDTRSCLALPHN